MKFEIRWTEDDRAQARRSDRQPMTDEDRRAARELLDRMRRNEVCSNCGAEWSRTTDLYGNPVKVCWECAREV